MGRKVSPTLIGAFVVGALALAVAAVAVLGSGNLFKHTQRCICFFTGTVDGLNVGAPVKFKGVEIGSVADIRLRIEGQPNADEFEISKGIRIPVIIEIDSDKMIGRGTRRFDTPQEIKQVIDLGLRAQLNAQSLVTGLLFVQLDFKPETPLNLVLPPDSQYVEIPTIPTALEQVQTIAQQIMRKLEDLHLDNLVKSTVETVDGFNRLVNAPELKSTIEQLPTTLANVNQAVTGLRDLTARLDRGQGPLIESLKATSDKTGAALEEARATLQTVQGLIDPTSPLASQLTASLQEIANMARAVRLLASYVERNPSSIVRGKDVNEK